MAGANFGFKYDDDHNNNKDNLLALVENTRHNLNIYFATTVLGQNLIKDN